LWRVITDSDQPPIEGVVKEPQDSNKVMGVHKIRVFPTKDQDRKLKKWLGAARWTYNQCVASMKNKDCKMNEKALRSRHINKAALSEHKWATEVPYDIRDEGMRDFVKALKATRAKKDVKHFSFKFRSRKDKTQSITVLKKHWNLKTGFYADLFNSTFLRGHQQLPNKLECDSRLIRTRLGHYYLCLPMAMKIQGENQAPSSSKHSTISLDPGVRTFMTGYDADASLCEWGKGDMGRIFRLCYTHDKLQARWSRKNVRHHQRYRMKIAARRIRLKIRNLVDELHKCLSKWLCENYRCVLIPAFETSRMVSRGRRKVGSKTARAMYYIIVFGSGYSQKHVCILGVRLL
jgi:hypothetical protein